VWRQQAVRNPEFAPFPVDEYAQRLSRARALMDEMGIDALCVSSKENVVYFTGIQTIGWESKHRPLAVIVPRERSKPVLMILAESLFQVARETSWVGELRVWGGLRVKNVPRDPIDSIHRSIIELDIGESTIAFELGYGQRIGMSQHDFSLLRSKLPRVQIVDGSGLLWQLRMIKSNYEISALRKVCTATSSSFKAGFEAIYSGMTEKELAGIIFSRMATETNERPGFVMIRSGERKDPMMNVLPFDKPMNSGDLIVVDAGAVYKDYWSDFMRMASIGTPTAEQERFFDAVYAAQQAGVEKIKPGVTAGDIFKACFDVLVRRGLKQHAILERVGHGVGLDMHEPPSLARDSDLMIQEGMILTVEPVIWDVPHARIGNFAIEDVVLVTEDGYEVLSKFPRNLHIVSS
jgi:Xaa-Pro dipeptidase